MLLLFECSGDHRDLHVLTHSFPTRRSSDLIWASRAASASRSPASASFCATQASPLASNSVGQYADDSERVATALRTARSEEHTSELQSLMRISYAVFCLKKKIYEQFMFTDGHCTVHAYTKNNNESLR